jgi:hypothetical protein
MYVYIRTYIIGGGCEESGVLLKLADFGSALDEYAWQKLYGTQVHAPLSYECMRP